MRILFSTSSFGFLRNFQSTVRLLAQHGHEIHLYAERTDTVDGQKIADTLAAEFPSITLGMVPSSRHRLWYTLGTGARASLDYWRYLDPRWDHSPKLRDRGAAMAPAFARVLPRIPLIGSPPALKAWQALCQAIDRVLPPSPEVVELLRKVDPDVLLLTPLLYFRSHQVDHVRGARRAGIKSIVGIGSWDHLTTKGLLHEVPDRVLVWNEAQKQEAIDLHGVPADRICVTGSQAYDHWFATEPSTSREAFFAQAGLEPGRQLLLYLCSSSFIAPYEVGFVRRWAAAIRASNDPRLRDAALLVRPHPQNAEQWRDVDLAAEFGRAAVWPRQGVNPIGGAARSDYFDSMYHAAAVVGVNTSGMIESGIIGRPVYAVQVEEFAATQDGTLHFQHLKNVDGGLLHLSSTLDAHIAQLERLPTEAEAGRQKARRFIQAFVRPRGLEHAATAFVVAEIEQYAAAAALVPAADRLSARLARVALAPLAFGLTFAATDPVKRRSIVAHWTRPVRLVLRSWWSHAIYATRSLRRLPRRVVGLAAQAINVVIVRPVRVLVRNAKQVVHNWLTRRKGEPGEAA
jgi:hypothetical protein